MKPTPSDSSPPAWAQQARARGLAGALRLALDVLEPLGPLGAQAIWVAQPLLGAVIGRDALHALAQALDEPGGVAALRRHLED